MPAIVIDGKSLAATLRAAQKSAVESLLARGVRPGLAAVLAGSDPASRVYVRNKARACAETGVRSEQRAFGNRFRKRAARLHPQAQCRPRRARHPRATAPAAAARRRP